jgi:hypothetical protein
MDGMPGEMGAQGEQGEPGMDGMPGEMGAQGEQGEPGMDGAPGEMGAQGEMGEQGEMGPQGEMGEAGPQGMAGMQGEKGDPGDPGGPKGDQGDQGDTGDTGPQGDKGDTGDRGPEGPAGPAGRSAESMMPAAGIRAVTNAARGKDGMVLTTNPLMDETVADFNHAGTVFGAMSMQNGVPLVLGMLDGDTDDPFGFSEIFSVRSYEDDFMSYGGWLRYTHFGAITGTKKVLETAVGVQTVVDNPIREAFSVGMSSGMNPMAIFKDQDQATWSGAMVGVGTEAVDAAGTNSGNLYQGDAMLTYTFDAMPDDEANDTDVALTFTNIMNLSTLDPGADVTNVFGREVMAEDGAFDNADPADDTVAITVMGQFYGPNGEEVGGTFTGVDMDGTNSEASGAFAASRDLQ